MNKVKRDFLRITDLTEEEVYKIFDLAKFYKSMHAAGDKNRVLEGKHIGLLFNKPSTRTRISFQVGIFELGGNPIYLSQTSTQVSRGETIADTSSVLSRYIHGLVIRTYRQDEVEEFAGRCTFPVVNALTDLLHPCQILSDFFTMYERNVNLRELKVTYIGDGNNICNSLILGACLLGAEIRIVCPSEFPPSEKVLAQVNGYAKISDRPGDFIEDADVIYTDAWVSMGEKEGTEKRLRTFKKYQVNEKLLERAKKNFVFMHCLPAHRGLEVTNEVMDGSHSIVFDQAENRLHCQKALLHFLYSNK